MKASKTTEELKSEFKDAMMSETTVPTDNKVRLANDSDEIIKDLATIPENGSHRKQNLRLLKKREEAVMKN